MALTINTNITNSYLRQDLSQTSKALSESLTRLSQGNRTGTTDDTAAVDTISSRLNTLNKQIGPAYTVELSQENLEASRASIRDTDLASESAAFTRNQLRIQAASAALAQPNTAASQAMALLRG